MPSAEYWQRRAHKAEEAVKASATLIAQLEARAIAAEQLIQGVQLRMQDQAALVSLTRDGRKVSFVFVRNDQVTKIEMISTWNDDVDGWRKALLER